MIQEKLEFKKLEPKITFKCFTVKMISINIEEFGVTV